MPASLSLPLRRLPFLCLPSNAITKMTQEITGTAADLALSRDFSQRNSRFAKRRFGLRIEAASFLRVAVSRSADSVLS